LTRGGGGGDDDDDDDDSDDDLVVTDFSLDFYTVCAASLTSYCNGMWVTGSWV
jgi:uncharacterized protein YuzB (UPF0349 family)